MVLKSNTDSEGNNLVSSSLSGAEATTHSNNLVMEDNLKPSASVTIKKSSSSEIINHKKKGKCF